MASLPISVAQWSERESIIAILAEMTAMIGAPVFVYDFDPIRQDVIVLGIGNRREGLLCFGYSVLELLRLEAEFPRDEEDVRSVRAMEATIGRVLAGDGDAVRVERDERRAQRKAEIRAIVRARFEPIAAELRRTRARHAASA